jgi:hypothetical protein
MSLATALKMYVAVISASVQIQDITSVSALKK